MTEAINTSFHKEEKGRRIVKGRVTMEEKQDETKKRNTDRV